MRNTSYFSNLGLHCRQSPSELSVQGVGRSCLDTHVFESARCSGVGHGPMGKEGDIVQPWQHSADGKPIAPKWNHDNPPVMGPAGRLHCSLPTWSHEFVADAPQSEAVLAKWR